jgi:hypothetical protein
MHRLLARALAAALATTPAACSKTADPSPPAPSPGARTDREGGSSDGQRRKHDGGETKHEDRHDPAIAHPPLALTVAIDGAASTWQQAAFDKVARFTGNTRASDGEVRDAWSLRDLARALVGPTARVTSVTGADGAMAIDRAAWADAGRTPVLHTTRRGTLKFRWADAAGAWGESEVRDVTRIEIAR